ncbi:MAG: SPFH/Band 7/PHB domain protein [Alphaproteobacteria bacterium]|nr:SPFH/Band 7/PHB domain protein [Alphaproteobacteria bacterium]
MEAFIPNGFSIFVIAVVILAIVMIRSGIKQVPQAQEWTVERFGKYTHTMRPGLNLLIPFIDKVGFKLSLRETVLDIPPQDVISYDNATITADGVAFYQIVDPAKAAYEVRDLERALTNLSLTNLRTVIGSMSLDDVLSKRDVINERLLRVIDEASNAWGIKVNRVEIKDLSPPDDLVEAMGRQMKAEREKRAEILTAEGDKQSAILRAEGQKQSTILEAEGRREAAFRDAEAREREAAAEAEATRAVSAAIAAGDIQAVNYFVAQRYIDAIGNLASAPNQRVILFPIEASSLIGSLGGIAELAKAAFSMDSDRGGANGRDRAVDGGTVPSTPRD